LNIPVKIFIAKDDPVIPYEDYSNLKENEFFRYQDKNSAVTAVLSTYFLQDAGIIKKSQKL